MTNIDQQLTTLLKSSHVIMPYKISDQSNGDGDFLAFFAQPTLTQTAQIDQIAQPDVQAATSTIAKPIAEVPPLGLTSLTAPTLSTGVVAPMVPLATQQVAVPVAAPLPRHPQTIDNSEIKTADLAQPEISQDQPILPFITDKPAHVPNADEPFALSPTAPIPARSVISGSAPKAIELISVSSAPTAPTPTASVLSGPIPVGSSPNDQMPQLTPAKDTPAQNFDTAEQPHPAVRAAYGPTPLQTPASVTSEPLVHDTTQPFAAPDLLVPVPQGSQDKAKIAGTGNPHQTLPPKPAATLYPDTPEQPIRTFANAISTPIKPMDPPKTAQESLSVSTQVALPIGHTMLTPIPQRLDQEQIARSPAHAASLTAFVPDAVVPNRLPDATVIPSTSAGPEAKIAPISEPIAVVAAVAAPLIIPKMTSAQQRHLPALPHVETGAATPITIKVVATPMQTNPASYAPKETNQSTTPALMAPPAAQLSPQNRTDVQVPLNPQVQSETQLSEGVSTVTTMEVPQPKSQPNRSAYIESLALGATPVAATPNAATTGQIASTTPTPISAIPEKIKEHSAAGKPKSIELTLTPEHLGKIRLLITPEGDKVRVVVQAENPDTLELLRRNNDTFSNDLRQSGYTELSFSFSSSGDHQHSQQNADEDSTGSTSTIGSTSHIPSGSAAIKTPLKTAGLDLRV